MFDLTFESANISWSVFCSFIFIRPFWRFLCWAFLLEEFPKKEETEALYLVEARGFELVFRGLT
jgi:hypothetical protein